MTGSAERRFPAKILLFGEHLLLRGATALAVPAPKFYGRWTKAEDEHDYPGLLLIRDVLGQYFEEPMIWLDLDRLRHDVAQGWFFDSNIPQGYGLGSSGAFSAALFHRYGAVPTPENLGDIKRILSEIESRFHGRSSGIDPTTSWANGALLIQNMHEVSLLPERPAPDDMPLVFLLDTGSPRGNTAAIIQWYLQRSADPNYQDAFHRLIEVNETAISHWIKHNVVEFWAAAAELSSLQWEYMTPMAPKDKRLIAAWQSSLSGSAIRLKICGTGGGGYLLGFARKRDEAEQWALENGLPVPIFPFLT